MALADYTDLQAAIAHWSARVDMVPYTPDFITLAEAEFNRRLRCSQQETSAIVYVVDGVGSLHTDYLEFRSVRDGDTNLEYMAPETFNKWRSLKSDRPLTFYTVQGDQLLTLGAGTGELSVTYYAKIPALADNGSNWLLSRHPNVYLYRSLMELAVFVKDDAGAARYGAIADRGLREVMTDDQNRKHSTGLTVHVS